MKPPRGGCRFPCVWLVDVSEPHHPRNVVDRRLRRDSSETPRLPVRDRLLVSACSMPVTAPSLGADSSRRRRVVLCRGVSGINGSAFLGLFLRLLELSSMYSNESHYPDGLTPDVLDALFLEVFGSVDPLGELDCGTLPRRAVRQATNGVVRVLPFRAVPVAGSPDGEAA